MLSLKNYQINEIPPSDCKPGQILGEDLIAQDGRVMLSGGIELTKNIIDRIKGMDIRKVPIRDPQTATDKESKMSSSHTEDEVVAEDGLQLTIDDDKVIIGKDFETQFTTERNVVLDGDVKSGAELKAEGNILIKGSVEDADIVSTDGNVRIEDDITGTNETVISADYVSVESINHEDLTVNGDLIVNDSIEDSSVECQGNLVLHQDDKVAKLKNANITVQGRMIADKIHGDDSTTTLSFSNPERVELERRKSECIDEIKDIKSDLETLGEIRESVRENPSKIWDLSSTKQKKLFDYLKLYLEKQDREDELLSELNTILNQLEYLYKNSFNFLSVLNEVTCGIRLKCHGNEFQLSPVKSGAKFCFKNGSIQFSTSYV